MPGKERGAMHVRQLGGEQEHVSRKLQEVCCGWSRSGAGVSEIGGKGLEAGKVTSNHRRQGGRGQIIPTTMPRERT